MFFKNSIYNIKEQITYFKDKNNKRKKKYKKYETLTTILKSFGTFVIITATSSSITLSLTGIGLIVIPISAATACGLSISNKVLHEIIINKYNKYQKLYERDQQTIKSFKKLYRKSFQDNVIKKMNMKVYVIFFLLNVLIKVRMNLFYNYEYKNKYEFFLVIIN